MINEDDDDNNDDNGEEYDDVINVFVMMETKKMRLLLMIMMMKLKIHCDGCMETRKHNFEKGVSLFNAPFGHTLWRVIIYDRLYISLYYRVFVLCFKLICHTFYAIKNTKNNKKKTP